VNKIEYIPTPGVDGVGPNLGNPDGIGIPKEAKYPKAAATFIKWLTSSTNQADFAGANGSSKVLVGYEMPSRVSAAQTMASKGKLAGGAQLIAMLKKSRAVFPQGAPSWYPEFSSAVNVNLHAAAIGSMTVPAAIAAIAATATRLSNGS
jgi:multiple sugar transport system substrate-binding protein